MKYGRFRKPEINRRIMFLEEGCKRHKHHKLRLCRKTVKQKSPHLIDADTSTFQWLLGNKEEQNKICWCVLMTDPSNLKNHCPEDEMSTINTFRESFVSNRKPHSSCFNSCQSHASSGTMLLFVFKVNVRHIQCLCTRLVWHLLCTVPFLSKVLLKHWSEVSSYLVHGDNFVCADTCRVPNRNWTSSHTLVQMVCSEMSHHAVERAVTPLFVQPK